MSNLPIEPVEHEKRAIAMMVQLRELGTTIHGFTFAAKGRRSRIASVATLPDEFLRAVAVACDAYPHLAAAGQITGDELRDVVQSSQAYTNVVNEMRIQAKGLEDTVAETRGDAGYRALRVYQAAKKINKPDERQALVPHLADMQRYLGRGRGKRPPGAEKARAAASATEGKVK